MNQIAKVFILILGIIVSGCAALQNLSDINSYKNTLASSEQKDSTITELKPLSGLSNNKSGLLSAFYGLDNGLPRVANKGVCKGAGGMDGMPVIFSKEIDVSSMQAGDFKVTLASGELGKVVCGTLAPADDKGELRTVLLAGEFGSEKDQPVQVEIVGSILSKDKSVNFKGSLITVTRLEDGASIVLAEALAEDDWELGKIGTRLPWGGGTGCPVGTKSVVRVVWAGGVSKPGGGEVSEKERLSYRVEIKVSDGIIKEIVPFALGDLKDGDNNHHLCLEISGTPLTVFFPAGHLQDPRGDLNPESKSRVINNGLN